MSLHDDTPGLTKVATGPGHLEAWANEDGSIHLDRGTTIIALSTEHDALVAFARAIVDYADQKTKPEPEPEPAAPTLDDFKPGDRVVVTSDVYDYAGYGEGTLGVVDTVQAYVNIIPDGYTPVVKHDNWPYNPDEIAQSDEPIPRVYTYPEGLYKDPSDGGRVFIRHEDSEEGYEITYLDDDDTGTAAPINHGMTDDIVASYTLVAPA